MNDYVLDFVWFGVAGQEGLAQSVLDELRAHDSGLRSLEARRWTLRNPRASPIRVLEVPVEQEVEITSGWASIDRPPMHRTHFPLADDEDWQEVTLYPRIDALVSYGRSASRVGLRAKPPALDLFACTFSIQPRPFLEPEERLTTPLVSRHLLDIMRKVPGLGFAQGYREGYEFARPFGIDMETHLEENLAEFGFVAAHLLGSRLREEILSLDRTVRARWGQPGLERLPPLMETYHVPIVRETRDGIDFYTGFESASQTLGHWYGQRPQT